MAPAISVSNLQKRYGKVQAVAGASFQVQTGELFGLLGPNGAGKTTSIEILEGLRTRDAGEVSVLGIDPGRDGRRLRERIGIQLQEAQLLGDLTVRETLELFTALFAKSRTPDELLDLVQLKDSAGRLFKQLSGGQKQRVSLSLALANDPELVFLDEPTSGIDPQARRAVWDILLALKAQGRTLLLTTHSMEEAERLCDRLAIVDHGKVIAEGSPKALVAEHFRETALELSATIGLKPDDLRGLQGVSSVETTDSVITLFTESPGRTTTALTELATQRGVAIDDLHLRRATLEDVFLKLTGRRIRE